MFIFDRQPKVIKHPARLNGIADFENLVCTTLIKKRNTFNLFELINYLLFMNKKDSIVDLLLALKVPANKLIVGVPTFGILYQLKNAQKNTPGSAILSENLTDAIISRAKVSYSWFRHLTLFSFKKKHIFVIFLFFEIRFVKFEIT